MSRVETFDGPELQDDGIRQFLMSLSQRMMSFRDKHLVMDLTRLGCPDENFPCEETKPWEEEVVEMATAISTLMESPMTFSDEIFLEVFVSKIVEESALQRKFVDKLFTLLKQNNGVVSRFLREKQITSSLIYKLEKKRNEKDFNEIRVAVVGNVDAGKSTLLGVFSKGELDDGRGSARMCVFRHGHEATTGRTSSVGSVVMGFDLEGKPVQRSRVSKNSKERFNYSEVCKKSNKIISFVDLAGHERYLKTTIFGLLGHIPDAAMLVVGANMGTIGMTREHLGLTHFVGIPFFIVVTKADICPPNVLSRTKVNISKLVKEVNRKPYLIRDEQDAITAAISLSARVCPVFVSSTVTGLNIDILRTFFGLIIRRTTPQVKKPFVMYVNERYSVPGVGTVLTGVVKDGSVVSRKNYLLGPFASEPKFRPALVRSIQRMRIDVDEGSSGESISVALKNVKRCDVRKGMVLVEKELKPVPCLEFTAKVVICSTSATISDRFTAVVHFCCVRQTARLLLNNGENVLRGGTSYDITFRLIQKPEFVQVGSQLVFREGLTLGHGVITSVSPYIQAQNNAKN